MPRLPLFTLPPILALAIANAVAGEVPAEPEKTEAATTEAAKAAASAAAPGGGPAAAPGPENKVVIGVLPALMQYDKKEFTVKPGEKVAILFVNKACPLQHNLIILKPGTDAAYGGAADKLIQSDAAAALTKRYAPDDPASLAAVVAASTKLIGPGQNEIIKFTAPETPGDYPYLCTFPGHRFLMKGVMKVVK